MKNIHELMTTGLGTEGQLLIPRKIHDTLLGEVNKNLIPRSEAALYFGPSDIPGSSYDVDLETPNTLSIRQIGEGAESPIDAIKVTSFNMKPVKYGVAIRITRELMEDSKFNMFTRNLETIGKRFAENETKLIIQDGLDNASNTVSGAAAVTINNITDGMQYLEDEDYEPTTFMIGTEVLNDLRNIDTFVEFNKVGNTDMLKTGFLGNIMGMNVMKFSSRAAPSTTYKKYAYIYDKRWAYAIAEKRPVSVENFDMAIYDMMGANVTQRIKVRYVRADAIAKITSS